MALAARTAAYLLYLLIVFSILLIIRRIRINQHWYSGPISDSVFGEPNTPQQKRQRYGLSNGSVYEATEPAVKASEAAHEATELVAKASEAAHAQHKDHVFIIRFAMIALGLSTMEASKTWTNSGNLRMPGCSSM